MLAIHLFVVYVTQLTAPPVNARALALLSSVAGDSLHKHLPKIIPALIQSLEELSRDENEEVGIVPVPHILYTCIRNTEPTSITFVHLFCYRRGLQQRQLY